MLYPNTILQDKEEAATFQGQHSQGKLHVSESVQEQVLTLCHGNRWGDTLQKELFQWRGFKSSSLVGKLKVRKVACFELVPCSRQKMPPSWVALVWSTHRCSGHTIVCRNQSVRSFTETKQRGEEWSSEQPDPNRFLSLAWASQAEEPSLGSEVCSTNLQTLVAHPTMVFLRALMGLIPASTAIPSWSCWALPSVPLTDVHAHNTAE